MERERESEGREEVSEFLVEEEPEQVVNIRKLSVTAGVNSPLEGFGLV